MSLWSWLRRRLRPTPAAPAAESSVRGEVVRPVDLDRARAAKAAAAARLERVRGQAAEVTDVAERLRRQRQQNHFADMVRTTFGEVR